MIELANRFRALLDSDPLEEDVQRFLADHPVILQSWVTYQTGTNVKVLEKVNLHDYRTDFAVGVFQFSTGCWEWMLVELERPSLKLFTSNGRTTHHFNEAMKQVVEWRVWIQNNLHFARQILPDVSSVCKAAIVIGRRSNLTPEHKQRLEMLRLSTNGVTISSYDSLVDVCEQIPVEEGKS